MLKVVNSDEMLTPLTPSYTLSDTKPEFSELGSWTSGSRGGCCEMRPVQGNWKENLTYAASEVNSFNIKVLRWLLRESLGIG